VTDSDFETRRKFKSDPPGVFRKVSSLFARSSAAGVLVRMLQLADNVVQRSRWRRRTWDGAAGAYFPQIYAPWSRRVGWVSLLLNSSSF
jgi:hypothetical protein